MVSNYTDYTVCNIAVFSSAAVCTYIRLAIYFNAAYLSYFYELKVSKVIKQHLSFDFIKVNVVNRAKGD